jgi:hypothetical protein
MKQENSEELPLRRVAVGARGRGSGGGARGEGGTGSSAQAGAAKCPRRAGLPAPPPETGGHRRTELQLFKRKGFSFKKREQADSGQSATAPAGPRAADGAAVAQEQEPPPPRAHP